jgi:hypothetical protein
MKPAPAWPLILTVLQADALGFLVGAQESNDDLTH